MAQPGQPSPQQIAAMQQQFAAEAAKRGLTPQEFAQKQREQLTADAAKLGLSPEQYVQQLRARAMQQHQQQMEAQRQGQGAPQPGQPQQAGQPAQQQQQPQQQTHQVPVNPNAPADPKALAVAKFLRSQNLKPRTCILDGQRKDMFKEPSAPSNPPPTPKPPQRRTHFPPVTDRASAENVFKLLPLSLLALRVSKVDPHAGHNHAKPKNRTKGLWTVKIEQHQETDPMMHYVWLWEGPQWKQKAMAAAVVAGIFAVVLFPLWPIMLRQGVWYLSVGMMGLLGLFFAMSIFRLILFCITVFAVPPGLWLFPNLFEDVGFFDSFKPLWGWQENKKKKKSSKKAAAAAPAAAEKEAPSATTTSAEPAPSSSAPVKRDLTARVEEAEE
ncbi:translocation protein Sec62-domain-containing protein [Penicillium chermesinum]|nr:translocation protein Sec62-domain-containing protein [Penicillium chermesinum]